MDGTLYLGDNVYEGAIELMNDLPKLGKSTYTSQIIPPAQGPDYITRLRRLGFPARPRTCSPPAWRPVCTSTSATRREGIPCRYESVLPRVGELRHRSRERRGRPHRCGDRRCRRAGLRYGLVYEKLDKACHFLRRGATFIAANPDWVCPMPHDEVLPDCGSICALLSRFQRREADLYRRAEPQHDRRYL